MEKEDNVAENDGVVEPHDVEVVKPVDVVKPVGEKAIVVKAVVEKAVETHIDELKPKPRDLEFAIPEITIPIISVDIPEFNAFPN